jgi:hypothetical protein
LLCSFILQIPLENGENGNNNHNTLKLKKMKKYILGFLIIILIGMGCANNSETTADNHAEHEHQEQEDKPTKKSLSPRTEAMANIGKTHVHIDYSAPSARGRMIFGGLVGYDNIWVTGAHRATSIDFSTDVEIDGQTIPKGKYAFFTIPNQEEWTLILNKNYEQHLSDDYDEALDVIRVKVKPETLEEKVETLTYEVTENGMSVAWENVKVSLPIKSKK